LDDEHSATTRARLLSAQSDVQDAPSPMVVVERNQRHRGDDVTGLSLPDPTGSRIVTTRLRCRHAELSEWSR
jgi:hypothetical protein